MKKQKNMIIEKKPIENNSPPLKIINDDVDLGIVDMLPISTTNTNVDVVSDDIYLKIKKLYPDVETPVYNDGCNNFNIHAYFGATIHISVCTRLLSMQQKTIRFIPEKNGIRGIYLEPDEIVIVPTGFEIDIPNNYNLLVYPNNEMSINHLKMGNCIDIIDANSKNKELMVLYTNSSEKKQCLCHGDIIAKATLLLTHKLEIVNIFG